ncbi:MAG TPA: 5'/3'-nucleotidase SurE [Kribbella sp.]|nr:5'/3'-nucleotidase SurE [Kribbella sp.]
MEAERLRVLVTNDDGVGSPGIRALADAVAGLGHDVLVVAPLQDESGIGSARAGVIGVPIRASTVQPGFIGIGGTPALAVTLARLGAFGRPPDLVVSGINHGHNIGVSILHSGTVAAALTAASQGMSALALSIDATQPQHLETAAGVAAEALQWLAAAQQGTVLSINVPDLPADDLKGVRRARLTPIGRSRLAAATGPTGEPMIVSEMPPEPPDPDTDEALLAAGYVTVTSITGIRERPDDAPAQYLDDHLSARTS